MFTQAYKILHITTHLGGGVGTTVLGLLSQGGLHEVVILGYATNKVKEKLQSFDVPLHIIDHKEILEIIPDFDIILIHWWNHPLLYDFLVRNKLPPCRIVMWGHNSGFHPPNIYTKKILMYPDIFAFTTLLTYKCEDVKKLLDKTHLCDVWSTGGVEHVKNIKVKKHFGFNIGYIGTVDYAKIHPDFFEMCKQIIDRIPLAKFIVVGGLKHKEFEAEAERLGIGDKFEFTGLVPDITPYLEIFDVFGYPLAPYHYGTCDLVLQEAMGAGVVPIVLDNPMEHYMVKRGTGIIGKYVQGMVDMHVNPNWKKELSDNARKHAEKEYSLIRLAEEWQYVFDRVLKLPKTKREWDIKTITPAHIFLESLGHYGDNFEDRISKLAKDPSWQTDTKGSVHNYSSYFPDDPYLSLWSKLMRSS